MRLCGWGARGKSVIANRSCFSQRLALAPVTVAAFSSAMADLPTDEQLAAEDWLFVQACRQEVRLAAAASSSGAASSTGWKAPSFMLTVGANQMVTPSDEGADDTQKELRRLKLENSVAANFAPSRLIQIIAGRPVVATRDHFVWG